MVYKVIGLMSGSSLDGLDIVYAELLEDRGTWGFEILAADCLPYTQQWVEKLKGATKLNALDYQLLHTEYGHYTGEMVNQFIEENSLHYKVALIASHGHTTFHMPAKKMTAQLGDGAAIAAVTGLPVVSDLRALDVAFGGQGAPIVPIGEKYFFKEFPFFLNIGGIANISINTPEKYIAFDVCPANRVLNMIASHTGRAFDDGGDMAASGTVNKGLLKSLDELPYYKMPYPKSLSNSYGTDEVFPIIQSFQINDYDALCTYVEHIANQVKNAMEPFSKEGAFIAQANDKDQQVNMLVTGGGAFNNFLIERLQAALHPFNIKIVVPHQKIVQYKEALIMALIGVLRWRQEYNVLSSVTGAERDSINGAVWIGQEA